MYITIILAHEQPWDDFHGAHCTRILWRETVNQTQKWLSCWHL